MAITLDIFWLTNEEITLRNAGVESEKNGEYGPNTKKVTFFHIDHIYPDGEGYCVVSSGGTEMVAKKKYEEVKKMMSRQMLVSSN